MSEVFDLRAPKITFYTGRGDAFITEDVYSVNTTRSMENPVATGRLTFWDNVFHDATGFAGRKITDVLFPYDLCKIEWYNRDDGRLETDGIYFISSVTPTERQTPSGPEEQTLLELVSIGEALVNYQIFYHPHIAGRSNIGGHGFRARSKGRLPQGRPDEVLRVLYGTFLNDQYVFRLADGRLLKDAFLLNFEVIKEALATQALSAMSAETPLWDTLKRYADSPFNELFVDFPHENRNPALQEVGLFGSQESIYLRSTPFSREKWDRLYQQESWGFDYDGTDLIADGENLGPRLDKLANFFWVSGKSAYTSFDQLARVYTQSNGKLPRYDEGSIKRFGLRRMEVSTEYVVFLSRDHAKTGRLDPATQTSMGTSKGTFWEVLEQRTKDLHEWFGYPYFWSGTLSTVGRCGGSREHGARIGGVLNNKRDGRQYYITGISQSWTMTSPHITSLTLTRGHKPAEWRGWWNKRKDLNPVKLEPDDGVGVTK